MLQSPILVISCTKVWRALNLPVNVMLARTIVLVILPSCRKPRPAMPEQLPRAIARAIARPIAKRVCSRVPCVQDCARSTHALSADFVRCIEGYFVTGTVASGQLNRWLRQKVPGSELAAWPIVNPGMQPRSIRGTYAIAERFHADLARDQSTGR
jgi:hypothetical protein